MEGSTTIPSGSRVLQDSKQDVRICRRCMTGKPLDDFYLHSHATGKRHQVCKDCKIIQNRQYRDGTTEEQYQAALITQCARCAICGTDTPGAGRKRFAMDHCHATGRFRGLLCNKCNRALGQFHDNPVLLKRGYEYLLA
jgi:hypothetical protein